MLQSLVSLIGQVAVGVYFLIGAACALVLWRWLRSHRALRSSSYQLERELARHRRANSFTILVLLLELALVLVGIELVVLPEMQKGRATQLEVVDGIFVTPVPAPTLANLPFEGSIAEVDLTPASIQNQIFATPVPTPTAVGTILPGAPPGSGCDSPEAMLQIPANGQLISGPLMVYGSAYSEDFSQYALELKGAGHFRQLHRAIAKTHSRYRRGRIGPIRARPVRDGQFSLSPRRL